MTPFLVFMYYKAGKLQALNRNAPRAILPRGYAEQNGSLTAGHHMLATWFRGKLEDHRATAAEAITSFLRFALGQVSGLHHGVLCYKLCPHSQGAGTWYGTFAHTLSFISITSYDVFYATTSSGQVGQVYFLVMMLWTELHQKTKTIHHSLKGTVIYTCLLEISSFLSSKLPFVLPLRLRIEQIHERIQPHPVDGRWGPHSCGRELGRRGDWSVRCGSTCWSTPPCPARSPRPARSRSPHSSSAQKHASSNGYSAVGWTGGKDSTGWLHHKARAWLVYGKSQSFWHMRFLEFINSSHKS